MAIFFNTFICFTIEEFYGIGCTISFIGIMEIAFTSGRNETGKEEEEKCMFKLHDKALSWMKSEHVSCGIPRADAFVHDYRFRI